MKRVLLAILVVTLLISFLGGSFVWQLLGLGVNLDISGRAQPHGRSIKAQAWTHYGGDAGGSRYVIGKEITPANVSGLEGAWLYKSGALKGRESAAERASFQTTPIYVDNRLIFCTQFNEVIALSPADGEEMWRFDPGVDTDINPGNGYTCRGVAHWQDQSADGVCRSRIFMGTVDSRLISLDSHTGKQCQDFGENGEVKIIPEIDLMWPGEFQITSAPVIAGDIVIIGSAISDNNRVIAPAGTVRAYDVRSGVPLWNFDPIPRSPTDPAAASWGTDTSTSPGHANVWSTISYDPVRDWIFLPTSSPSPDFYGGLRPGDNRYTDSVVALEAKTGKVIWDFQTVHHDVWDYDLPAQPGLYTITDEAGSPVEVVAQATKTGMIFVLDRDTGEPVIPVEERPVPQGGVVGEVLSPTQPFPVRPPSLVPNKLNSDDAYGITLWDRLYCESRITSARSEGLYTPPGLQGTILYPFTGGGVNWGSSAFDPRRNLMIVNMSNIAHLVTLVDKDVDVNIQANHEAEYAPIHGAPYAMTRETLLSPLGLPCSPAPWGLLAGVNIQSGEIVWRRTFGSVRRFAYGVDMDLGMPNLGGPMVTETGLVFIGASLDDYIRAFDVETGTELWEGELPAGGQATPMSYTFEGRQFIVIAAGGHKDSGLPLGDSVVAFALP